MPMTLEEIQRQLADDVKLDEREQAAMLKAIRQLEQPMKGSLLSAFYLRYPPQIDLSVFDEE